MTYTLKVDIEITGENAEELELILTKLQQLDLKPTDNILTSHYLKDRILLSPVYFQYLQLVKDYLEKQRELHVKLIYRF